jgi:hypothetical protein
MGGIASECSARHPLSAIRTAQSAEVTCELQPDLDRVVNWTFLTACGA